MTDETKKETKEQPVNVDPSGVQLFKRPVGDAEITLPCGLLIDGEIVKEARISPMTGKDRKDLVSPTMRNNPAKIISRLIENRLLELGEHKAPGIPRKYIKAMLAGDRDFILMKLHQISNPTEADLETIITCPARRCGEEFEVTIPYEQIKLREMPSELQEQIDAKKNVRFWAFESEAWGVKARFRFMDGKMQEDVAPKLRQNVVEGEYMIFAKMILDWNGLTSLTISQIEELPKALIEEVENSLGEHQYGPDFEDQVFVCPSCGMTIKGGIDFSSFLFQ